jgi:hypothetical protein
MANFTLYISGNSEIDKIYFDNFELNLKFMN